jgi:methylmalonyl-CoA mutase cobalamin-binding subunit
MFLEEHGNEVVNLGPCVPDEYLVAAARRHRPDLVVVSSISGHGLIDGCRLIRTVCRDPVVRSIPVVIGGKLGISGDDVGPARELLAAGFAAVFTGSSAPGDLLSYLDGLRDGRMSVLAAGRA